MSYHGLIVAVFKSHLEDREENRDPYEGMWHVFQTFNWNLPESNLARKKMAEFLEQHLGK